MPERRPPVVQPPDDVCAEILLDAMADSNPHTEYATSHDEPNVLYSRAAGRWWIALCFCPRCEAARDATGGWQNRKRDLIQYPLDKVIT